MSSGSPLRALCVSLHDVAPTTWSQCERWLQAIASVADIPVSLLVVPSYHSESPQVAPQYEQALERRLIRGDELILHGYTHLDQGPPAQHWREHWIRSVYTRDEGEFFAIDEAEVRHRLALGLEWFAQRGWPVEGFVAPAWLLGPAARRVLADSPLRYTTTRRYFQLLGSARLTAPAMAYGASGRRTWWAMRANRLMRTAQWRSPLLRLALHPPDIEQPDLVADAQRLIVDALDSRWAMTKGGFARSWQGVLAREESAPVHGDSLPNVEHA